MGKESTGSADTSDDQDTDTSWATMEEIRKGSEPPTRK